MCEVKVSTAEGRYECLWRLSSLRLSLYRGVNNDVMNDRLAMITETEFVPR